MLKTKKANSYQFVLGAVVHREVAFNNTSRSATKAIGFNNDYIVRQGVRRRQIEYYSWRADTDFPPYGIRLLLELAEQGCGFRSIRTPVPIQFGQCSGIFGQLSERSDALR
jgi:hypothetical protein